MLRLIVVVLLTALLFDAAAVAADPTFTNHPGPADIVGDAGEPSIGYNPKSGAVLFQAATQTARVDFSKSPPVWSDVTYPGAQLTLDPILYTDRDTGRTFTSQLILACSITVDGPAEAAAPLVRHATGGSFLNFLQDPARTHTAYTAEDYRRLREVKRAHDPANVFGLTHNIPPAAAARYPSAQGTSTESSVGESRATTYSAASASDRF